MASHSFEDGEYVVFVGHWWSAAITHLSAAAEYVDPEGQTGASSHFPLVELNVYPVGHSVEAITLHLSRPPSNIPGLQTAADWHMLFVESYVYPDGQSLICEIWHTSDVVLSAPPDEHIAAATHFPAPLS